ncbi:hypothetical protein D3C72_596570 [compost metagenome]
MRFPTRSPAKSGTCKRTQTTSTTVSAVMMAKLRRQPTRVPSRVPAGIPSDSASGAPSMATVMARPCRCGATMRLAYPASSAQSKPANTPAIKRAIRVSQYHSDRAVMLLAMAKPPIADSKSGLRRQPRVAIVRGIAASIEPIAYSVTNWPISAWETFRLLLICGNRPAGMASVMTVMNPAVASASSAPRGSRSRRSTGRSSVGQSSCVSFMSRHPCAELTRSTG